MSETPDEKERRKDMTMRLFYELAPRNVIQPANVVSIDHDTPTLVLINNENSWNIYEQSIYNPPRSWEKVFHDNSDILRMITSRLLTMGPYYPSNEDVYNAFRITPIHEVRVVIIGQDPYPQNFMNMSRSVGMSFSVRRGDSIPNSLQNIYKEIKNEYHDFVIPNHGDLTGWARQGVLLLNKCLTVTPDIAGSHGKLWMGFISQIVRAVISQNPNVIFVLWGKSAEELSDIIGQKVKQLVSVHPSGLSASRGFFGNNHFISINMEINSSRIKDLSVSFSRGFYPEIRSIFESPLGSNLSIMSLITQGRFRLVIEMINSGIVGDVRQYPGFDEIFNFMQHAANDEIDWNLP